MDAGLSHLGGGRPHGFVCQRCVSPLGPGGERVAVPRVELFKLNSSNHNEGVSHISS